MSTERTTITAEQVLDELHRIARAERRARAEDPERLRAEVLHAAKEEAAQRKKNAEEASGE